MDEEDGPSSEHSTILWNTNSNNTVCVDRDDMSHVPILRGHTYSGNINRCSFETWVLGYKRLRHVSIKYFRIPMVVKMKIEKLVGFNIVEPGR